MAEPYVLDAMAVSYNYQRNYNWDVLLPDFGNVPGLAIGNLVQKVSFGDYSVADPKSRQVGPYREYFVGLLTVPEISLTFLKTFPDIVSIYFQAWKEKMIDSQGLFHAKNNYQRTMYVRFLNTTGNSIGRYKLIGCFPVHFPDYSLSFQDNAVTMISIKFRVDKLEYEAY